MPKYTTFSIKLEIWGFKGYGFSLARIQEIYAKKKKQGIEVPHKNTIQRYSREYDLFDESKKDIFQASFKEWTPVDMPDAVPYSAVSILLELKLIFSVVPELHLPLFTKGLAKWAYIILCAFGIEEKDYERMIGKRAIAIPNIHRETPLFTRITGFNPPFSNKQNEGFVTIFWVDILKWSEQCLIWEVEQEIEGTDNKDNFNGLFSRIFSLRTHPGMAKSNLTVQAPGKYIDESVGSLIRRFGVSDVHESKVLEDSIKDYLNKVATVLGQKVADDLEFAYSVGNYNKVYQINTDMAHKEMVDFKDKEKDQK